MVEPESLIVDEQFEFDLQKDEDPYSGSLCLTEGGQLHLRFEEGVVSQEGPFDTDSIENWEAISGSDETGREVEIKNAITSRTANFSLREINTTSAIIKENEDQNCADGDGIAIDFDVTCFKTGFPPVNQMTDRARRDLDERSSRNIPDEMEKKYFDTQDRSFYGISLTDTTDRVDFIKERGIPIRTGKIRVKQDIPGSIEHQVDEAKSEVRDLLDVSQLVQETSPRLIRGKVVGLDGQPPSKENIHYEQLFVGSTGSIGGRFSPFPGKNLWANFPEYLEAAYKGYTERVRDNLHLQPVLSYYVDARMSGRTIEGSLLSTCSAIELFSLWHAREDDESGRTGEKIQHTINKLGVEVDDLIAATDAEPSELEYREYFWKDSRNHVSHGDPNRTSSQLWNDQEATLIVLKRLIRNQLLGEEEGEFEKLYNMSPRERITFDD